ncbi:hypothetical protein DUI70_1811 [Streptomyces albus]|nr:hypothetical protein DUI70_1811 [Streptomyces albus]
MRPEHGVRLVVRPVEQAPPVLGGEGGGAGLGGGRCGRVRGGRCGRCGRGRLGRAGGLGGRCRVPRGGGRCRVLGRGGGCRGLRRAAGLRRLRPGRAGSAGAGRRLRFSAASPCSAGARRSGPPVAAAGAVPGAADSPGAGSV